MPLRYLDDGGYSDGVIQDEPSFLLGRGQVPLSSNMIYDKPGIARQRGGTTAIFSGAQTAFATSLEFCRADDDTPVLELIGFGGPGGSVYRVDTATGIATLVISTFGSSVFGRGVQHFGFLVLPATGVTTSSVTRGMVVAGQVDAVSFTSNQIANLVSGNKTITLTAPDATTNTRVGQVVFAATATQTYLGRVTRVINATTFNVWPAPTFTSAIAANFLSTQPAFTTSNAACAASFQNRLVYGNIVTYPAAIIHDRRLTYSVLPTESYQNPTTLITWSGAGFGYNLSAGWPDLNFIDVPGTDPFVGLEPVSDNELLILSNRRPVVFRGDLITQLSTTAQQVTFDISELDKDAGCATDHSIRRTPRGIVWAGEDGIFLYVNGDVHPVLPPRMANYWQGLARSTTFSVHGSAYLRGHYLVTASSGGTSFQLLINLQSREFTFAPLTALDIVDGVAMPTHPSRVFALRWYDTTGAAPSMTNGQVVRLDSILDSYTAGSTKTDADGSAVTFSITTRVLLGDVETQKIMQRATVRYQAAMATAAVTVTAQTKIDTTDITAASVRALGSLSNTETRTINSATNATPIVCTTTVVHGLQTGDYVDINAVLGNLNANGRWRITVLSTTTFSLNGSSGSAAYVSGGSVKKVTETDFLINTLDQGQGVSFIVASSGTVNNFELHGFRVAYLEGQQVSSA